MLCNLQIENILGLRQELEGINEQVKLLNEVVQRQIKRIDMLEGKRLPLTKPKKRSFFKTRDGNHLAFVLDQDVNTSLWEGTTSEVGTTFWNMDGQEISGNTNFDLLSEITQETIDNAKKG